LDHRNQYQKLTQTLPMNQQTCFMPQSAPYAFF